MSVGNDTETDVLVIGAGPVGLATAIELARRGHSVRIIEKESRIGRQPRAKTTNVRSMEHMRRWGLADKIRKVSPLPADYANDIVFATGIFGYPLTRFENAFFADQVRDPRFAESAQWIPQYAIEEVLRDAAIGLASCRLDMSTELISLNEDADGVTAEIQDLASGTTSHVRARYVVGADGARSTVRQLIGATMEGDDRIGKFLSLVMRIPGLGKAHKLGEALMYWLVNARNPCVMGPMDSNDTWFWGTQMPPDAPLDSASTIARVQAVLGPDQPFEILVTDIWLARRLQASSYGTKRMFLVGDACHLHPPFGGYGMNLGIADGVDLGWKLAAALEGWAGSGLLASYEEERRPAHKRVIDESVENMAMLMQHFVNPLNEAAGLDGDAARAASADAIQTNKDQEFHSLGLVLGVHYAGSAIVVADGSKAPAAIAGDYRPSASPGCRAPHAWLADGSSLYDHFGMGFTLLALASGLDAGTDAFVNAADSVGLPLKVVVLTDASLAGLYEADLALIRPDQHVAWRGNLVTDVCALLDVVRGATPTKAQSEMLLL